MGAIRQFQVFSSPNGVGNFAIPAPTYIDHKLLASSGTAESVTIPTGADYVVMSGNGDFYARWDGGTAAVPSSDVGDGTGSELNPTVRKVEAGDSLSLVAPADNTVVTMLFYKE